MSPCLFEGLPPRLRQLHGILKGYPMQNKVLHTGPYIITYVFRYTYFVTFPHVPPQSRLLPQISRPSPP